MATAATNTPMQNFMLSIAPKDEKAVKLLEFLIVLEIIRIEEVQDNNK